MQPYGKHPDYVVWQTEPYNGEPPAGLLRQSHITPLDLFYTRNHGPVPTVEAATYRLAVGGLVRAPLSLSLADLHQSFPRVTQTTTLQCAGNRRTQLLAVAPIPGEVPWQDGAISSATWGGVLLRDVLAEAGVEPAARHVAGMGLDQVERHGHDVGFGGSIPLVAAVHLEALLAFEMNGAPLTPLHGFPLRLVVPGYIGARSVKWLASLTLQAEPTAQYFQSHAYKIFPPHIGPQTVDWEQGLMLGELSVTAAITTPRDGAVAPAGPLRVEGYAMAGGSRTIERVDVSTDGGATWQVARLTTPRQPGVWAFWEADVAAPTGGEIIARAWDSAANTQPEDLRAIWNFKGYMNNAWARVRVSSVGSH